MANKELLDKIRQNYESARQLAKDVWISTDSEGDSNDYYYFECGFIAGLGYNFDGSFRQDEPKYSKEFLEFAENLFNDTKDYEED